MPSSIERSRKVKGWINKVGGNGGENVKMHTIVILIYDLSLDVGEEGTDGTYMIGSVLLGEKIDGTMIKTIDTLEQQ